MPELSRLLSLASWWCGRHTAQSVFEPLLADWQHELEAALLLLWIAGLPSGRTAEVDSMQTQWFMLSAAGVAVAPVLLPVLFLMRRDPQSTSRHAASAIALGAALVAAIVTLTSPERLNTYFSTFASLESAYQRNLANDRAGRVTYPGTAIRERRGETTIEQRRADYERFMAWRAEQEASRPPLTWRGQLRRMQPAALAILFGVMGWTLAGLGPVSFTRAAMWWALMYAAMLTFNGLLRLLTGVPMPTLAHAYALPIFGVLTAALVIASWRRREPGRT